MIRSNKKRLLGAIFVATLTEGRADLGGLARKLDMEEDEMGEEVARLAREGLVEVSGDAVKLSQKGRRVIKVVFIGGGFEVIHAGHLHTIEAAKALGDVLVAVVARDSTVMKRKGRAPATKEQERVKLLGSIRQVDAAILGGEGDIYDTLERVRPDMVALGYDQHHQEAEISREAAKRGLALSVVRLDSPVPSLKTSRLLNET